MTTVEAVKQCSTPREALLLLAAAIDELKAAGDPWSEPLTWEQMSGEPPKDNRAHIVNGDVVVKPVSPERQLERADFFVRARLDGYVPMLDADTAREAYVKGGPRWLYYTNRDCIMQMPFELRQALVADVLIDSPSEADEIGRDILKYDESMPQAAQVEALRRDLGPLG
jgi:hypothetical protein